MSDPTFPVMIQTQSGPVQVGVLTKATDGIFLNLGEMFLGEARPAPAPAARPAPSGALPTNFPNYGRGKNGPIAGASQEDLDYYAAGCRRTLADQNKARWHDTERALLDAIVAEQARQGSSGQSSAAAPRPTFMGAPMRTPMFRDEPPGPTDDDIPFPPDPVPVSPPAPLVQWTGTAPIGPDGKPDYSLIPF